MSSNIDTSNVLVGFATMFTAPVGTANPAETLAYGAGWVTPWTAIGATEAGLSLSFKRTTNDITIEEQATPVLKPTDTIDLSMAFTLMEDTLINIQMAYGSGSLTVNAATSSSPGYTTLALSEDLSQIAVGFEGLNPAGLARRVVIPIAVSTASVDTTYRRAKTAREYACTLSALCSVADVYICNIDSAATGG